MRTVRHTAIIIVLLALIVPAILLVPYALRVQHFDANPGNGESLPYPAGIADIEALTGVSFDSDTYNSVPQLIYMGSIDDNDSLDFTDGWDEPHAQLVDQLFGDDPLSRWEAAEAIYRAAGANVQFLLVDGIGHDRRALQNHSTEFFKKVLNEE